MERSGKMVYSLIREGDGAGDSGSMCQILDPVKYKPIPNETYPRIGYGVRVGSSFARSYSSQDWWQTSPVTEILEETKDEKGLRTVKFKTRNSVYTWKEF
jgi:hypothetical protein